MVLKLRVPPPSWEPAKCLGESTGPAYDPWFDNSEDGYENQQGLAQDVCNGVVDSIVCPIRHECMIFALLNNEKYGVWGGLSEQDRRLTRKIWPWDSKNPTEPHPEWKWRSHEDLQRLYQEKFGKNAPVEEEDDEMDGD